MIAIVVANWNGLHFLRPFLASLEQQSYRDFLLIVVDNGSNDGSRELLTGWQGGFRLQVIALPENTGFAHANNLGIEAGLAAGASQILTLNNDMELAPDCLEALAREITSRPGYAAYQILQINHFDRSRIDGTGIGFNRWGAAFQIGYKADIAELARLPLEPPGVIAGAACYNADALRAVRTEHGYFDRRFFAYFEDVDLCLRLRAQGGSFRFVPAARVFHVHSGTGINNSPFKTYYLTRNLFFYLRKNLAFSTYLAVLPYHLARLARELAGHVAAGRTRNFTSLLRGLAAGMVRAPTLSGSRPLVWQDEGWEPAPPVQ